MAWRLENSPGIYGFVEREEQGAAGALSPLQEVCPALSGRDSGGRFHKVLKGLSGVLAPLVM